MKTKIETVSHCSKGLAVPDHVRNSGQAEVQIACCKSSLQLHCIEFPVVVRVNTLEPLRQHQAS